jgi:hypothetical protein
MTKTTLHAAALALAVAATAGTFVAADALARQQYAVAQRVVLASMEASAPQTVIVVARRHAAT